MPVKNWYVARGLRFAVLYLVAQGASKAFALLAALAQTPTMFDDPLRIAVLAGLGIAWPTFAPAHFDWLRTLTASVGSYGNLRAAAVIWAPFVLVATLASGLGVHSTIANDVATTWAIAGMLALSDRELPGERRRLKRDADEALRRLVASYEAVYGRAPVPIPLVA